MLEGLYTAAAGLDAQERVMDGLANDVANLDTPGYKAVRVSFRDLLYSRSGRQQGPGAGAAATLGGRSWSGGALYATDRNLDVAIEGPGFFQVREPGGRVALTRNGSFALDARGRLTTENGARVMPGVTVAPGADVSALTIASDGTVTANGRRLGRVSIVDVAAADGLRPASDGLFEVTAASGPAVPAAQAKLHQGQLKASSASPVELVGGQRTFELLTKVIEMQDQMLATANKVKQ